MPGTVWMVQFVIAPVLPWIRMGLPCRSEIGGEHSHEIGAILSVVSIVTVVRLGLPIGGNVVQDDRYCKHCSIVTDNAGHCLRFVVGIRRFLSHWFHYDVWAAELFCRTAFSRKTQSSGVAVVRVDLRQHMVISVDTRAFVVPLSNPLVTRLAIVRISLPSGD